LRFGDVGQQNWHMPFLPFWYFNALYLGHALFCDFSDFFMIFSLYFVGGATPFQTIFKPVLSSTIMCGSNGNFDWPTVIHCDLIILTFMFFYKIKIYSFDIFTQIIQITVDSNKTVLLCTSTHHLIQFSSKVRLYTGKNHGFFFVFFQKKSHFPEFSHDFPSVNSIKHQTNFPRAKITNNILI